MWGYDRVLLEMEQERARQAEAATREGATALGAEGGGAEVGPSGGDRPAGGPMNGAVSETGGVGRGDGDALAAELAAAGRDLAIDPPGGGRAALSPRAVDPRARNAWKHGIHARQLIVETETAGEFEGLREALVDQWRPRSVTQWMLVDHLARLQWRLMRAGESEVRMVELAQTTVRGWDSNFRERREKMPVDRAMAGDLKDRDSGLAKLQLFQMRLERSVHRTITLLITLRKLRGPSRGKPGKGRAAGAG